MLVTFRTKASANITMFGDAAIALLKYMGQTGVLPGALVAQDVPAALARLRASVARAPFSDPHAAANATDAEDRVAMPVSLRQRAFPLIQLLEAAARKKCDVIWEQEGAPASR